MPSSACTPRQRTEQRDKAETGQSSQESRHEPGRRKKRNAASRRRTQEAMHPRQGQADHHPDDHREQHTADSIIGLGRTGRAVRRLVGPFDGL
jgi:hypothetical protein